MSNTNSIRSIPSVEVASSSDTNAPVFYFNQYNQSQEYFNNRERIDFVTYEGSLYVPGAERVVPQTNDITRENFVLLVSRGPQGLPGIKGDPGRDGRTPSVFARFDGKQMIFYTNELNEDGTQKINERTGEPVIKRIAATNDLTGPSWRPKRVDDTIIWEKTRDDSQPESINLSDFVKETAPVIFRVDSDNTKRTDETSGPANYIQWKYEGDEYWNNLISISELMNLTLAGVSIWFNEDDQRWHFGHREVEHAYYDSTPTGKRIITDVELGEVLYDAGPLPESNYDLEIYQLGQDICDLKNRVEDIEEELPKFVKSVEGNRPDENGDVKLPGFVKSVEVNGEIHLPDENGKVELPDYYTKEESDNKYLTPDDLDFELVKDDNGIKLYVTIAGVRKEVGYTCDCKGHEPTTVPVTGVTITNCVSSLKVGQTGTIVWSVSPNNATDISVTFTSSDTSVATVSSTGVVTANAVGSAVITVKTTDGNYTDTCNVDVTNDDEPTPSIPDATVYFTWSPGEANAQFIVNGMSTTNHQFTVHGNETITWEVTAEGYHAISNGTGSWKNTGSQTTKYINIVFEKDTEPGTDTYIVTAEAASCDPSITVVGVSTNENGPFESSLPVNKGESPTIFAKATRTGHRDNVISQQVSESEPTILIPCEGWTKEKYTLTINSSNAPSGYSIKVNNEDITLAYNKWEHQYEYDDPITVLASKADYTVTIKEGTDPKPNPYEFKMTKNTSINITWTEVTPGTYTVNTSISGGNCSSGDRPDTLTISKTQNGTYGSSLTFNEGSGNHTIHVKATKNGKVAKTWTETVNGATTITLDSSDSPGCSWEDETVPCSVSGVTVSPSTLTLIEGQTNILSKTVNSTGTCENTVTWSSTDPSVATVDQTGKVTAVSAGTATIKATSNDNETKVGQCAVTVNSIQPTTYTASVNAESGCAPTSYTLTSNDVSVDNDSLSGLANGSTVTLVAKRTGYNDIQLSGTINNQNYVFNINCRDWVSTVIPVTGVTIDPTSASITRYCNDEDDSITLTAQINPSNATNKTVTWSVTNPGTVVSITPNGLTCKVEPAQMAGGTATVTVTTADGNKQATSLITVKDSMIINTPSLNTASGDSSLYLLPLNSTYQLTTTTNPSNASVTWSIDGSASNSGISVSNSGLVTGTRVGAGIAIATNTTTGCHDNVRFQVYDEETITITRVDMESTGTDWIDGQICTTVSGHDTGYYLDYLIYPVDSNGSRPTSSTGEIDVNNDVAVGILNENCEEFNIDRSNLTKSYAYILVRDHFNSSIKAEAWVRVPEPIN